VSSLASLKSTLLVAVYPGYPRKEAGTCVLLALLNKLNKLTYNYIQLFTDPFYH